MTLQCWLYARDSWHSFSLVSWPPQPQLVFYYAKVAAKMANYSHSGSYFNPGDYNCNNGHGRVYFSLCVPLLNLTSCKTRPTCTLLNERALWGFGTAPSWDLWALGKLRAANSKRPLRLTSWKLILLEAKPVKTPILYSLSCAQLQHSNENELRILQITIPNLIFLTPQGCAWLARRLDSITG